MKVLVIPSCRQECLREFLDSWEGRGGWDKVILVEDGPEKTFSARVDYHYSWREIEQIAGPAAGIFSRRDSAIRCFGFLAAWWLGAEYVLTLDDDCCRDLHPKTLFDRHVYAMTAHPRWTASEPRGARTRGIPYRNLGTLPPMAANVGLWTGHADYDAIQALHLLSRTGEFIPGCGSHVLPHGQYAPLCGMNLCIRRDALPLFYFPPMGEGQPFSRFDDIWAGIIAKKCCDALRWQISCGEPFVEHRKASDPFINLVKEAPGIAANETFWEAIDGIPLDYYDGDPVHCMDRLATGLVRNAAPYISRLGHCIKAWCKLFRECPEGL